MLLIISEGLAGWRLRPSSVPARINQPQDLQLVIVDGAIELVKGRLEIFKSQVIEGLKDGLLPVSRDGRECQERGHVF